MLDTMAAPPADSLPSLNADLSQCSVSGLSSGAFMTVQLHLAHSSLFVGAGVIAGGPYRSAESFRAAAPIADDAYLLNALYVCMNPLTPYTGPDSERLVGLARETEKRGLIDPLSNLAGQKVYIFTGSEDKVVDSCVVRTTRAFYEALGVANQDIEFVDDVPAGHSILTSNLEDNPIGENRPPYINRWTHMQSWDILDHIYGRLERPKHAPTGRIVRFDQREFFNHENRASMSAYGYAYVPKAVEEGAPCRVHVVLHGCMQGYNFVPMENGKINRTGDAPYGNRYYTTTGYNELADANNIVVLYPQAESRNEAAVQNPNGCWDWWGYTCPQVDSPDYYSQQAIQIKAIHGMLQRLGGKHAPKARRDKLAAATA
ncbi:extracellular catalytic domain type 2 short-chain-length polyhydroxyalkanoate depolymerase [Azohydromonas lata]|uniref:extracellular catalytic domain type 2 short-chain-length polyhydroxyalkanoate depolymerase n=1 Tax=Azohydromonas lata TaxID=45677 RepID=UPI000A507BA2|nr:poly(3-hydroxybutyrate) depolymerase [Azohydromonas lata]